MIQFNCSLYQSPSLFFMHNSVKDGPVYMWYLTSQWGASEMTKLDVD